MIHNLDQFFQRYLPHLSIAALLLGLVTGKSSAALSATIPWFFAVITFSSGLGMRIQGLYSLAKRPWVLPLYLAVLHILWPLVAWCFSSMFFGPEVVMGFVILTMIPVSASSIIWVGILRGNVTLAMALIFVDTMLAPFLVPYALQFFFGTTVYMDPVRIMKGLFWMFFVPTLAAITLNRLSQGGLQRVAGQGLSLASKLSIFILLFINGGITSPYFLDINVTAVILFCSVFFLYCLYYIGNFSIGRLVFSDPADIVTFMIASSMRSLLTGMVIAMTYFSPMATFVVVLGMFFQQPMSSVAGKVAGKYLQQREPVKPLTGE
ncbi:hypothetical protein LJC26_02645 [Desulfovibrio sp. OttesenSCG-928-O18]|nr:hypothetical protein [Desulfovibrio sp. OttesenSCG-928-O18]